MRRRHFLAAVSSTVIVGSGCLNGRNVISEDFPENAREFCQFQYDAANSGVTTARTPSNESLRRVTEKDDFGSTEGRITGLALTNEHLIAVRSEELYSLDPDNGSIQWSVDGAGGIPACTNGIAYVKWSDGLDEGLRAIDLTDGGERWRSRSFS